MGGFLPPAERRSTALLGLYAVLSLLLLVTADRVPVAALRGVGSWVFAPLDRVVLVADRMVAAWRENQRLHERITELELENLRLRSAGVENLELRRQLDLPPWRGTPLKPVEILALAGEPTPTAAVLSAGKIQQVEEGDAVVTSEGLLGRVSESYAWTSRVLLITDPSSAVACEVESTGVLGILRFGTSPRPRLLLTGVPLADTVRGGQRVLTSGLSRRYPRGIPVGTIGRTAKDPSGLTQEIEVLPAARLAHVRHGFVLPRLKPVEGQP